MRTFNKKVVIIYALLSLFLLITSIYSNDLSTNYNMYINPIFWIFLVILTFILFGFKEIRYKGLHDKIQIMFIGMLIFTLLYFLSGLLFDFANNIYSTKLPSLLKNIWMFAIVLIFKEIIRERLIHYSGNKFVYLVLITILFIISDIELFNIKYYFQSSELFFKYFFSTIFPIITSNIVCTYLVCIGGYKTSLAYRLPLILIKLLVPIQPDLDWFMMGIFEGLLPVTLYLFINRYHVVRTNRKPKREIKDSNPIFKLILIGLLIIFGFFVGGIFKYKPIAVMSGSMEPVYFRGDLVIVEKINEEDCKNLKLYDIIEYKLDDKLILHRIIKIENNEGKLIFTTKGDNNEIADEKTVEASQIGGKIKYIIKYIGYPSVLLNEYFYK